MENTHQDRKVRVAIKAWRDALWRGLRMSGAWTQTVATVIFSAFAAATVVWVAFSEEPAQVAGVIALVALIALIVLVLLQAPYRGQKAMTDEVRQELTELRSDTEEIRSWAEAQRQNFQQYVHAHAEDHTKGSSETLFHLRLCNGLYANLQIDSVEGQFLVNQMDGPTVSLRDRPSIQRGQSGTVTLVAHDSTIKGRIEFRGRMDVTVFGESHKLEFTSPGLSPIWDVGRGGI